MKKIYKQLLAGLLAILMVFTSIGNNVYADILLDNGSEKNKEILSELEGIALLKDVLGEDVSDEDLQKYYEILQNYGLLDSDGSEIKNWDIWLDGKKVTLDEIKALLEDENCDLSHQLLVDGQAITLGDVKTMIEIEEYITYLKETYFTEHQWTGEQQANLKSLMAQIENSGITMVADNNTMVVNKTGISHSARVSVEAKILNDLEKEFVFNLTGAGAGQVVTFDAEVVAASQKIASVKAADGTEISGETTLTLTADDNGNASTKITVTLEALTDDYAQTTAKLVYYLKLGNIKNALFTDGTNSKDHMMVKSEGNRNFSEDNYKVQWGGRG